MKLDLDALIPTTSKRSGRMLPGASGAVITHQVSGGCRVTPRVLNLDALIQRVRKQRTVQRVPAPVRRAPRQAPVQRAASVPVHRAARGIEQAARLFRQAPGQAAGFTSVGPLYAWYVQALAWIEHMKSWPAKRVARKGLAEGFLVEKVVVGEQNGRRWMSDGRTLVPGWPDVAVRGKKVDKLDHTPLPEDLATAFSGAGRRVRRVDHVAFSSDQLASAVLVEESGKVWKCDPLFAAVVLVAAGGPHAGVHLSIVDYRDGHLLRAQGPGGIAFNYFR